MLFFLIDSMGRTRSDLPLWAKVLFETPELVTEVLIELRNSISIWRKDIHVRSSSLALIEADKSAYIDLLEALKSKK